MSPARGSTIPIAAIAIWPITRDSIVNVHIDPAFDDEERRRRIYAGDIVVYSNVPEVADFAALTRGLITDVFAPHGPTGIHQVRLTSWPTR